MLLYVLWSGLIIVLVK